MFAGISLEIIYKMVL